MNQDSKTWGVALVVISAVVGVGARVVEWYVTREADDPLYEATAIAEPLPQNPVYAAQVTKYPVAIRIAHAGGAAVEDLTVSVKSDSALALEREIRNDERATPQMEDGGKSIRLDLRQLRPGSEVEFLFASATAPGNVRLEPRPVAKRGTRVVGTPVGRMLVGWLPVALPGIIAALAYWLGRRARPKSIELLEAGYGVDGNEQDVRGVLRRGSFVGLEGTASNALVAQDLLPGTPKRLRIKYKVGGETHEKIFVEGQEYRVP